MNDQIREIEERCNAATKGEWEWDESDAEFRAYIEDDTGFVRMSPIVFAQSELLEGEPVPYIEITENDADFIAHARTDVPALLAEVKRLTRELDAFKGVANTQLDLATQYKKELDAAVEDMQELFRCDVCKYSEKTRYDSPCDTCWWNSNFKWRGSQEGE